MEDKRFYGRRKGKPIKESRQKLIDGLLPKVSVPQPQEGKTYDLKKMFGASVNEVWLEVGFGGGEHVAELAKLYPSVGIIGAEPFLNGVASLLAHLNGSHMKQSVTNDLEDGRVDNVRIWPDDIRLMFPYFPDKTFQRIYVLYPDPWPKARHAERRFINARNIRDLYRMLADDGTVFVATDVKEYAEWAMEQMQISGLFEQTNTDIHHPPQDWIPTRYEKKGIQAKRQPSYLFFQKKHIFRK